MNFIDHILVMASHFKDILRFVFKIFIKETHFVYFKHNVG